MRGGERFYSQGRCPSQVFPYKEESAGYSGGWCPRAPCRYLLGPGCRGSVPGSLASLWNLSVVFFRGIPQHARPFKNDPSELSQAELRWLSLCSPLWTAPRKLCDLEWGNSISEAIPEGANSWRKLSNSALSSSSRKSFIEMEDRLSHHRMQHRNQLFTLVCLLSCFSYIWLFVTPLTVANVHGILSMRFSRQEYWSGLLCPPSGDLPHPGIKPESLTSSALADELFTTTALL